MLKFLWMGLKTGENLRDGRLKGIEKKIQSPRSPNMGAGET